VVLWDKGLGKGLEQGVYQCPQGGYKRPAKTFIGRRSDEEIRRVRMIVEQSYSRIKSKFPIFNMWRCDVSLLAEAFFVATALTNIDITTDHPIVHTCGDGCTTCILIED